MKPKRHKGQGLGTLIASLQVLLSKANSSEISQSLSQGYKTHTHENYKTSENKNIVNHVSRTDLKQLDVRYPYLMLLMESSILQLEVLMMH